MSASIKDERLGLRRLEALAWLDQSNERLENANDAMKSFHWQLTKARQSRQSTSLSALAYSACDVREEFVAQYRLVEERDSSTKATRAELARGGDSSNVPVLTHEGDCKATVDSLANLFSGVLAHGDREGSCVWGAAFPDVVLVSAMEASQSEKENSADESRAPPPPTAPVGSPNKPVDGLRSRRGKAKPHMDADPSEWTVENEAEASPFGGVRAPPAPVVLDAMDLFGGGLAPRELQRAKEKAQEAMRLYVQAANHRRRLLSILS